MNFTSNTMNFLKNYKKILLALAVLTFVGVTPVAAQYDDYSDVSYSYSDLYDDYSSTGYSYDDLYDDYSSSSYSYDDLYDDYSSSSYSYDDLYDDYSSVGYSYDDLYDDYSDVSYSYNDLYDDYSDVSYSYNELYDDYSDVNYSYDDLYGDYSDVSYTWNDLYDDYSDVNYSYDDLYGDYSDVNYTWDDLYGEDVTPYTPPVYAQANPIVVFSGFGGGDYVPSYYEEPCYDCEGGSYYPPVYDYPCYDCGPVNPPCYDCGPINPPTRYDNLRVVCEANPTRVEEGDEVEWIARVYGGDGDYDYKWSGDVDGDDRIETERYRREGTYRSTVRVRDDHGNTDTATCSVRVEDDRDYNVPRRDNDVNASCVVSDSSVRVGEQVSLSARVNGGDGRLIYSWSGAFEGNAQTETVIFNQPGTYTVALGVRDADGDYDNDTCSVVVEGGEILAQPTTFALSSTSGIGNPPTGQQAASVSSVLLSQVPYTGPADALPYILWSIVAILGSVVVVRKYNTTTYRKAVTNRVEAFKEANRQALK